MSDTNLRLQVVLSAVDKITRPFRSARDGSKELSAALKASKDGLKSLNEQAGRIDGFRKTRSQLAVTANNLKAAREEAARLAVQFTETNRPTAQQARLLEQAKNRASQLQETYNGLRLSVQRQREALNAAGIDTKQLSEAQRRLKTDAQAATGAIERQQAELRKLGERQQKIRDIQARHEKLTETRNKLAGNGAGMVATGVATGATLMAPVRAYADSENAATQLAASMMGPGAKVLPEYEKINRLAVSLGDKLPGTTADFQNMMTMLRRQGMSAQAILGGLGEATAYLGVQLQMAPTDAAEFAAKLQDATQTSEKDMMALTDIIQKGFYAGVDSENMLQGFSKIGSAMDIIKKKGIDAAREFAPLLVMADQQGMDGGSAGNAYRKVLQAMMDNKKIKGVNEDLKGTGVKFDFTNGKGEFAGIKKMYAQLDQLKALSTEKRLRTLKDMFGDDAETLQVLNNMITKGLDGYRETAAKLDNQASLRERVDASLKTLSNRWDAASGSFTNAMAAIGETVAPVLKQVADWLGNLAGALGSFVKQHPQLTAALFKIAAGFAIVTAGIGAALLVFASTIGPMLLMRMLMNKTGLQAFSSFGLMRKAIGLVGNGVLWLGRLMMANPILAVIGLIAMGAIYIWQNWDTLGPKFAALWDGISTKVSNVWTAIRTYISTKWEEIEADVKALPARFQEAGSQMIDGLLAGISQKWDALKSKLSSLTDYLPDFLKPGNDKPGAPAQAARPRPAQVTADGKVALPPGGFPAFPRMYDTGGHIPSGQLGIVGENGPEIVNGPANITSRRRTAALAASAALAMGMAATPAAARPLHPMSQPAQAYRQEAARPQPVGSVSPVTIHAPITIMQQPGQSAQDVADEVMRRLEAKERQAKARARSSYHDREGLE
ncbi:phage tail tape measure protein [Candidatus Pantoea alvi]|uniref:phage tail tape measure protein n=1 Tax=Enterobacter agglomerans TaxID=549 RepID=UPI000CDD0DCD|nr:phage tail tape measure protein [Pantoea agglomerans]POW59083.1 phage tail tape measure protein [Pantoea alvi]UBN54978.1 phage tail tape measure protein [Pantoea agglomerans]